MHTCVHVKKDKDADKHTCTYICACIKVHRRVHVCGKKMTFLTPHSVCVYVCLCRITFGSPLHPGATLEDVLNGVVVANIRQGGRRPTDHPPFSALLIPTERHRHRRRETGKQRQVR